MEQEYKILIVDDEDDIREFIGYNLKQHGFSVFNAKNGKEAIEKAIVIQPHLIILDVMMPEMDGIETCERLRNETSLSKTVIAFLTARSEDYSQIAGFEAGADDYINKPIRPKVLVSRIKALLKRYNYADNDSTEVEVEKIIRFGNLLINKEKHHVQLNEEKIILPRKEFGLLLLLASKAGKVFTRDEIYHAIWGASIIVGDRTIDVHIRKLREKLGDNYITTVKGVGYKFDVPDELSPK